MRGLSRKQLASRRARVRVRPGLLYATLVGLVRDMPAKHVWLSSNLNSVLLITAHRSSLEWTLPCHGGDHRFESGMGRLSYRVWYANG